MDFPTSSFRASAAGNGTKPQAMFKALRRLHGQNLESKGLNDMTEAFQTFVTRARFFSVGKLRRTWSHSAVEFMKYRRLLPMLLADGQQFEAAETDDFDAALAFHATSKDEKKIVVTNISPRVTPSQLQSFFSQFGKITHCSLPRDEKKHSIFATLPKHPKNCGTATLTFKRVEDARKAKSASKEQLKFYDQVMIVSDYVSKRKGGKGMVLSDESKDDDQLSRASSIQSLASNTLSLSCSEGCSLDDMPCRVLERIVSFLPVKDTIRVERVNKRWMEASMKSWSFVRKLTLSRDGGNRGFSKNSPLLNTQLKALLSRTGSHLRSLDISGVIHLLDEKSIPVIARFCPNLTELDISGLHAKWEALGELSDGLSQLEILSYRDVVTVSDKAFWFLLRANGKGLRSLDIRGCSRLHGRCFKLLGPKLEMLYADGCLQLDAMSFEDLCTQAPNLRELRINECYNITDENLSMISRTLEDLQVLTLCGEKFANLTEHGMHHICRMRNLVELALDFNPLVDAYLLRLMAGGLVNLKTLSLSNAGTDCSITSAGIRQLSKLPKLEQLDISSVAAVRSSELLDILKSCPLHLLQLRNCTYLTDEGVRGILECPQIQHVDLSGSILVTSESIQSLIRGLPQNGKGETVTLVVGGTAVDASKLSIRGSRVIVDFSDYSSLLSNCSSNSREFRAGSVSEGEESDSDEEFESLTAQRSFYIDSGCGEDESPIENEQELRAWAEREARNLGLIGK